MNVLNLKLQEKDNLFCDLYRIIKGFQKNLSLFEVQLERRNCSHFQFCTGITEDINLEFPKIIHDLNKNFLERFSNREN